MEIKNKVKETSPTSKQSGPFDSYINSNSGQQQNCLLFHKLKMSAFDVNVTMVGLRCRRDLHSASVIWVVIKLNVYLIIFQIQKKNMLFVQNI